MSTKKFDAKEVINKQKKKINNEASHAQKVKR
jgi:hypothetical protein